MTTPSTIMIVDDDEDLLQLLSIRLQRTGFSVKTETNAKSALNTLQTFHPNVVITDLKMQDMDGLGLLTEIETQFPVMPVIVLTAHGTIPDAVSATKKGAFAFLTKPINDTELLSSISQAVALGGGSTGSNTSNNDQWRSDIITRSPAMASVLQEASLAAVSDASIIIESESGTGKELLARAIHAASGRANEAFITVNCSAIPENLFESEMFGHAKGSFTGAYKNHIGLFQQADKGTLFLDEIGDMPLAFQTKLLRALQERSVRPVGLAEIDVDVRIIVATHRDLEQSVRQETFREDLYYRLNVVSLRLPTLSERREDIPLLADHFVKLFGSKTGATGFSHQAMERLVGASWPGNVRQLANVVQQCLVLCRSKLIPLSMVEHALKGKTQGLCALSDARNRFDYEYLNNLLQVTEGNVAQAARLAGRNRSEFYKLLKKHELDPSLFRVPPR